MVYDYTKMSAKGLYLEGTGSVVIDHDNKIVYACRSPRTDLQLLASVSAEAYGTDPHL